MRSDQIKKPRMDNSPSNPDNIDWRARKGRLTSRDIASAAGVSQATVSNVLNRPELVAPATIERVMEVMHRMNFVINDSARALRAGRSRTQGVIVLDLSNPFWGEVTRGIEAVASANGFSVLLGSSEELRQKELTLIRVFEEHRVDGLLVSSVDPTSESIQALADRGMKVVLLDQKDPTGTHSSVSYDQVGGTRLIARHLIENGHRNIVFLNVAHNVSWSRERLKGLRDGTQEMGFDPDSVITELTIDSMTAQAAEPAVDNLLEVAPQTTAIFCANDLVALGVLKQLHERGIRVPEDVSVVGFDDSYFASLVSPGLTTVRQQPYELGRRAAQIAFDTSNDAEPQTVVFAPELVVRQSVRRVSPVRTL